MLKSWKLGKLFGIEVYLHWTFLLLPTVLFFRTLPLGGFGLAVFAALLILAIFACVLMHEFGHALMARRFGILTRDITLYPIGGVAPLERMSRRPWEEFCIALAGPAVNVAIALVLCTVLGLVLALNWQALPQLYGPSGFLTQLLFANGFLVIFNMIPAFPMDGGRVLRALLASRWGHLRATELAARLGLCLSCLFMLVGMLSLLVPGVEPIPMLILVGGFVFVVGQQELAMVRHREAVRRAEPLDVLPADASVLHDSPAPARPGFTGFIWDRQAGRWVQWRDGRPVLTISVEPR